MSRTAYRMFRFGLIILAATMGSIGVASAEVSDDCSAWTFLPDFRCEDRTARPADAFNPVGMPFLFEDPHITSDLDFAYVYHRLPAGNPALDGLREPKPRRGSLLRRSPGVEGDDCFRNHADPTGRVDRARSDACL